MLSSSLKQGIPFVSFLDSSECRSTYITLNLALGTTGITITVILQRSHFVVRRTCPRQSLHTDTSHHRYAFQQNEYLLVQNLMLTDYLFLSCTASSFERTTFVITKPMSYMEILSVSYSVIFCTIGKQRTPNKVMLVWRPECFRLPVPLLILRLNQIFRRTDKF